VAKIDVSVETDDKPAPPPKHPNTCPSCHSHYRDDELELLLWVCGQCGHHFAMRSRDRVAVLADGGSFVEEAADLHSEDPLGFFDLRPYTERLAEAEMSTGLTDAMVIGQATLDGRQCELAVMDFAFMGGSMGSVVGEKFSRACDSSAERGVPLIAVTSSGGARMQEGILSLMQLPRTTVAVQMLREARQPYIVVLTNPTTGGVTASYAMLGDVHIAEPGALIGFAGPRVIEQTIREKLPEGFQRAEYLKEHGMVDMVVHRHELRATLANLCRLLTKAPAQGVAPKVELPAAAVAELPAPASV
jgi:acetyl-CoA carboxylase carboxyl transferase subunit beta